MLESLINAANVEVSFKVWEIVAMTGTVAMITYILKLFINGKLSLFED